MSKKIRVLFAEDDDSVAALVEYKLRREGVDVLRLSDGLLAAENLSRAAQTGCPFDFAILDGRLPGRDGVSILEECALFGWTQGGVLATADAMEGLQLPWGWSHLRKPFDLSALVQAVFQSKSLEGETDDETVLAKLKAEFESSWVQKADELEQILRGDRSQRQIEAMRQFAHRLAGAAGLYGEEQLDAASRALEDAPGIQEALPAAVHLVSLLRKT